MDLFDSIDKLLPLLFLFIWVIVGLAARGKKRAKPTPPSSIRRPAGVPAPKSQPRRSSGMGELKKTLQKVFEEIQVAAEQPEIDVIPLEREVVEPRRMAGMRETVVEGESTESLETSARRKLQPASSPPATIKSRQPIPLATVRQGIIWSEILASPRGMRSIQ